MSKLYTIELLNNLKIVLSNTSFVFIIIGVVLLIILIAYLDDYDFNSREVKCIIKYIKISITIILISLFIKGMIPSKKTMYSILELDTIIENINNNDSIKVNDLKVLDNYINNLKEK